jgi:hypothetical protein
MLAKGSFLVPSCHAVFARACTRHQLEQNDIEQENRDPSGFGGVHHNRLTGRIAELAKINSLQAKSLDGKEKRGI